MTLGRFVCLTGIPRTYALEDKEAKAHRVCCKGWRFGFGMFSAPFPYRKMHRWWFGATFSDLSSAIFCEGKCQLMFRLWRVAVAIGHRPGDYGEGR